MVDAFGLHSREEAVAIGQKLITDGYIHRLQSTRDLLFINVLIGIARRRCCNYIHSWVLYVMNSSLFGFFLVISSDAPMNTDDDSSCGSASSILDDAQIQRVRGRKKKGVYMCREGRIIVNQTVSHTLLAYQ